MAVEATLRIWKYFGKMPFFLLFKDARNVLKMDELGQEIAQIAVPTALALMADPIASLADTAFIGRIGPVELAGVGVAIAVFNQVSKIVIFPLISITTSFVAEEDSIESMNYMSEDSEKISRESAVTKEIEMEEIIALVESRFSKTTEIQRGLAKSENRRRHIPSASSSLVIGGVLGMIQALILVFSAKHILTLMGVDSNSPMLYSAQQYLVLRSLGAPAVLLSFVMQGIFRGFKNTRTPLYATIFGDVLNVILDPILMFTLGMGVCGAAIAHVISQYLASIILLWRLTKEVEILTPSIKDLQLDRFLKNGGLLMVRVIGATFCVTMAASLAARKGPTPMAAFQICLQSWLTTSLLADGLAVAAQAILASAFAKKDYKKVTIIAARVLQMGFVLGIVLSIMLLVALRLESRIFTNDLQVLLLIHAAIPFVAATQPINTLAFVFDGVNYGASDFAYSAYTMVLVAMMSILCLLWLSSSHAFVGIWLALSIYMSLRALFGLLRIGCGTGPWRFLWGVNGEEDED